MGEYREVEGDLIKLSREGAFDVIAHGCNCFCTQSSGLAPQMVAAFGTDVTNFELEGKHFKRNINKLGQIEYCHYFRREDGSLYTEIIKYSTLLERAKLRNKIFIDKLK